MPTKIVLGTPDASVRLEAAEDPQALMRNPSGATGLLLALRERLLSFGGTRVLLAEEEPDAVKILCCGQLWYGDRIRMMLGDPHRCHSNAARCWQANRGIAALVTGYALAENGTWFQHSWCIHIRPRMNRVVETTTKFRAYYGFILSESEADWFCYDNE